MCGTCFSVRNIPLKIVMWLSFLVFLVGIVMIVYTFLFTNADVVEQMGKQNNQVDSGRKFIFVVLMIFAFVTIIVGCLGCVFKWVKNKLFACVYGFILLPTWIMVITVGAFATWLSFAAKDKIEEECEDFLVTLTEQDKKREANACGIDLSASAEDQAAQINSGGGSFRDKFGMRMLDDEDCNAKPQSVTYSLEIYDQIFINQYACSRYCPCKETTGSKDWLTNVDSKAFGRVEPFVFNTISTQTTYKECIVNVSNPAGSLDQFYLMAESFKRQDNFEGLSDWMDFFESEFNCAGVCRPALFHWSVSVEKGRPIKSCVSGIKDALTDSFTGLAISTLVAGFLLLLIFVF